MTNALCRLGGIFICALLWAQTSIAQNGLPAGFEHLTVEDGLSQSSVTAIAQDRDGFLWLGTANGLNRYDGYAITSYHSDVSDVRSVSHDYITCLFTDSHGRLWIGTRRGLDMFDSTGKGFIRFIPNPSGGAAYSRNHITGISENPDGTFWISTFRGIARFSPAAGFTDWIANPDERGTGLSNERVFAIAADTAGHLYLGTQSGLDVLDRRTGVITSHFPNPASKSAPENVINRVLPESGGTILVGSFGGGLFRFTPSNGTFASLNEEFGLQSGAGTGFVQALCRSHDGSIWVGTREGIAVMDPKRHVTRFRRDVLDTRSLGDDFILSLREDNSGMMWVGTQTGGVDHADRKTKFATYRHRENDPRSLGDEMTWAAAQDSSGAVWVGTEHGLYRLDDSGGGGKFIAYHHQPANQGSIADERIQCLTVDRSGILWVGTSQGLQFFDSKSNGFHSYGHASGPGSLTATNIVSLLCDHEGNLWVGTDDGLNVRKHGSGGFEQFVHDSAKAGSITGYTFQVLFEDRDGALWAGTPGIGINRMDPSTRLFQSFGSRIADSTSLTSNNILCMGQDSRGGLWVGTDAGLNRYDAATGTFQRLTRRDGLPSSMIYAILPDTAGRIWLSTNCGIIRFNPEKMEFRQYNSDDGLQSMEFNRGACTRLRKGAMLFGGIHGFNIIDPDQLRDNPHPPRVIITSLIREDNTSVDMSGKAILELSYNQNIFGIEYVGLEYADPRRNRYSYKLDGVNTGWVDAGTARRANYTNLDPGEYVFHVRAANSDGVWGHEEATLHITINPPFWQRWFFRLMVIGALSSLVIYLNNRRVRQRIRHALEIERVRQQEHAAVRKRAADDFHDEFGHKLTRIAILGAVARQSLNGVGAEIASHLDLIVATSTELSAGMRDFLWTLNPDLDTARDLAVRLKDFGDELYSNSGISFHMAPIDDALTNTRLPVDQRRHATLLFKEAMHNSLKHSHASTVCLSVSVNQGQLDMTLQDDGVGFDPTRVAGGQGLPSMAMRAAKTGGALSIRPADPHGTLIELRMPIDQKIGAVPMHKEEIP